MIRNNRVNVIVAWLVLSAIWGSTWAFIKLGLADLPPITFVSARFILALLVLGMILAVRRPPLPTRAQWKFIALTGMLQFTLNYGLIFWGERFISSGLTALLQSTIPLFGFVIAHRHLEAEGLSMKRIAGLVIGLVGVAIIFSDQLRIGSGNVIWGSSAILAGAICVAYANIMVKSRRGAIDGTVLVAGQMACGLIPLLLYSVIHEGNPLAMHWTSQALFSIVYLALIGTVVAFLIFYWLVREIHVTSTQLISLVTPAVAVLIGVLFLREHLSSHALLGGAAILLGIAVILWTPMVMRKGM